MSYPTPTYYAHLVADRARKHHNELAMADNSSCSGNSKGDLSEKEKLDIKKRVEEGICKAMYFVWTVVFSYYMAVAVLWSMILYQILSLFEFVRATAFEVLVIFS